MANLSSGCHWVRVWEKQSRRYRKGQRGTPRGGGLGAAGGGDEDGSGFNFHSDCLL